MTEDALLYHEPGIATILILSSFLLILNIVGHVLDGFIYCGLVGQIFIGIAWGKPGGHWLSTSTQDVFVQLGYLGLILLVFEGGISTDFKALKSNLWLSICVAITGIGAPIGISFVLMSFADATPLQAFAASAALCSTSLGTTFTILKTSGLTKSRLGVILTSAAMLDDVVGLVMVQIISNLGAADSSSLVVTVIRPVSVSLAFAIGVPFACWLLLKLPRWRFGFLDARWPLSVNGKLQEAFLVHTAFLLAFVAASSYAGTSNLFATYIAGASISWYDSEVIKVLKEPSTPPPAARDLRVFQDEPNEDASNRLNGNKLSLLHGDANLEKSLPTDGSQSEIVPASTTSDNAEIQHRTAELRTQAEKVKEHNTDIGEISSPILGSKDVSDTVYVGTGLSTWEKYYEVPVSVILKPLFFASIGFSIPISRMFTGPIIWRGLIYAVLMATGKLVCGLWLVRFSPNPASKATDGQTIGRSLPLPKSLYPASILGCAMVARGEIGFLISAVAESRGIFSAAGEDGSSELFLIVTWAIMLCTMAGPIAVGLLASRVRNLQGEKRASSGGEDDPLEI